MNKILNILVTTLFTFMVFSFAGLAVNADSYEDSEGSVNIPGKQVSVIDPRIEEEQEIIEEAEGEINDGVLSIALNFETATRFAVQVNEVCGDINDIVIEVNKPVTGVLEISDKAEAATEGIDEVISVCNFEMQGFGNDDIAKVNWNLKLNRSVLEEKEIGINEVRLLVLDKGNWKNIKTEKTTSSNSESVFYEAETDNFSDGEIAIAKNGNNIFSAQNIAYAVFSVLGLLVLAAIGYLLLKKEE